MSGTKGEMEERKVGMRRGGRERERGMDGPERVHLMKRGEKLARTRTKVKFIVEKTPLRRGGGTQRGKGGREG